MKRASGVSIPTHFDDLCDPACTALLIYDMQVGICQQLKSADTIVAACIRALTAARSAGMRVVFTRHLSCPRAWMVATQYRTAMNWQRVEDPAAVRPWFLRGSPASAIIPELEPSDDELVLDKLAMSAFEGTPLAFALRDSNITGIAILGIALEIGIELAQKCIEAKLFGKRIMRKVGDDNFEVWVIWFVVIDFARQH